MQCYISDIDECEEVDDICHPSQDCVNSIGSYTCQGRWDLVWGRLRKDSRFQNSTSSFYLREQPTIEQVVPSFPPYTNVYVYMYMSVEERGIRG